MSNELIDRVSENKPHLDAAPLPQIRIVKAEPDNERAFLLNRLFREHWAAVVGRLRNIHGAGPPDPEDLAQRAFEKLAQVKDLTAIQHPRAFIFRIAVNVGLDQISKQRTIQKFADEQVKLPPSTQSLTPESVYLAKENLLRLQMLMSELPLRERDILYRSRFKGETLSVIGKELGLDPSTVSRILSSVLLKLKTQLNQSDS